MRSIKYFFIGAIVLQSFVGFSQSTDGLFMKWKLKPGSQLSYKTTMEEIDTANHKNFNMNGMLKLMDADSKALDNEKLFKQLNDVTLNANFITRLKKNKNNIIDVEMSMNTEKSKSDDQSKKDHNQINETQRMMAKMLSGVVLRGTINEVGQIESFYTKNEQKNMIAMFFELPGRSVKIGDSWPISINLISMDQNFICDSSYKKNNVTVTSINSTGNEHIVTLKYDIEEYVNGDFNSPFNNSSVRSSMKMFYKAIAEFSIEQGKWVAYNGIMSLSSTGIMTAQATKKLSLVEE